MRWIPWIVLGVLAAGVVLIFMKNSPRAPQATVAKDSPGKLATPKPASKQAGVVAPAAFAAPTDTRTARRNGVRQDTALAAYNQDANQAEETAPSDANSPAAAGGSDAPAVPNEPPAGEGGLGEAAPQRNANLPAGEEAATGAPGIGAVPAAAPPADAPPAAAPDNSTHPLPAPRSTAGNGDGGPLSNLDPPVGARAPLPATHDSAHQPYYPSAKPMVAGPLPRRNPDAWEAIHRKAAMKAEMRGRRLTTQKWFGYSNLRPTASATPFLSTYSPTWTGNTAHPAYWTGVR